jgi:hypothetical protein
VKEEAGEDMSRTDQMMRAPLRTVLVALLAVSVSCVGAQRNTVDVAGLFRRALANDSTAPSFALITLVSPNGESTRQIAIPAPFLLGAIHSEYHLDYDDSGTARAKQIALTQRDRVFQFKNPAAVNNVQPRYSEQELAIARERLNGLGKAEVLAGFRGGSGKLDALYNRLPGNKYAAMRDAIAQLLIERGFLVGIGCFAGVLTVSE